MHTLPPHAVPAGRPRSRLSSGSVADDVPAGERCQRTLVPRDVSGVRVPPARYLQQVKLGHEAPRQMQEAVPSVREGHRHDRPTRSRTR